jgi:hypothetical protein
MQEVMDEDDWERELEGEDLPRLTTIRKALHWLPRQWAYLTKHWLRVVELGQDRNRARWPVHPTWQVIQQGFMSVTGCTVPEEGAQLVRAERHAGKRQLLARMEAGLLSTAYLMLETDPTLAVAPFLERMRETARRLAAYQRQKQATGRERLNDRRQREFAEAMEHLTPMVIGVMAAAGVLQQHIPTQADLFNLVKLVANEVGATIDDTTEAEEAEPLTMQETLGVVNRPNAMMVAWTLSQLGAASRDELLAHVPPTLNLDEEVGVLHSQGFVEYVGNKVILTQTGKKLAAMVNPHFHTS